MRLLPTIIILQGLFLSCRAQLSEYFDETLRVTPLKDGKVASTFTFKTVLSGASPRDPERLGEQDVCECAILGSKEQD